MAQLVGRNCALCGGRIATAAHGAWCASCGAPVHAECARVSRGRCPGCDAQGPPEPPKPHRATLPQVRLFGGFFVVYGLALALFCQGDLFEDLVPVPWIGYVSIAVGVGMLGFPTPWRRHVSRIIEKEAGGWTRPAAARATPLPAATFEGTYETIRYTKRHRPFPLRGRGRLTIAPNGLEATGQEVAMLSPLTSILVATAVAGIALVAVALAFTVGAGWLALLLGIPVVCAPFARRRARGEVTIPIPWQHVHGFREASNGRAVRILVKKMRPRGEISFAPEAGALPALAALHARGG